MLQFLSDFGFGPPQFVALVVLPVYYTVVATTHLCWIASLFFLIPSEATIIWSLVGFYLALQVLRYWIIITLGQYWTHRIISLDGAEIVARGPYKFVRHPNYVVTVLETLTLPLCFGAWSIAILMTLIWGAVIRYKIVLEDDALQSRRQQ